MSNMLNNVLDGQAQRIAELEKQLIDKDTEIERHKDLLRKQCNHSQDLKQKLSEAVKVIEFYGNDENMYDGAYENHGPFLGYIPNDDDFDYVEGKRSKHFGKRARQFLAGMREG